MPEDDAASSASAGSSDGPGTGGQPEISVRGRLTEVEVATVLALVGGATEADGAGPLSEHVMLHLRYGGDPRARNLLLYSSGELAGYAHLDPTDPVEGPSGELVIHPAHRGQGLGLQLTRALVASAGRLPLRLWAHGDLPAATRLAVAAGFKRVRALWQMRRSLQARIGRPQVADGITIRTFVVGRDEEQWLELNRKAFARHPEQGAWTRADLDLREREPWFDPDGFFLAERGGKIVGFHWTKIHGRGIETPGSRVADLPGGPGQELTGGPGPGLPGGHTAAGQGGSGGTADAGAAAEPSAQHAPAAEPSAQHAPATEPSAQHAPATGPSAQDGAGRLAPHGAGRPAGPRAAPSADLGAGPSGHGHEPIGEVYVVGVDPAERGTGLGRALTVIGLRYLRSRGLFQVMLYVDETNTAAIGLYESLGFSHWDTDVMFSGPAVDGTA